jgi:hypothetical protein
MERTVTIVSHPPAAAPAAILIVVDGLLIFRLDAGSRKSVTVDFSDYTRCEM